MANDPGPTLPPPVHPPAPITEEMKRTVEILRNPEGLNITSRERFTTIFDKDAEGYDVKGIDDARSKEFVKLVECNDEEWVRFTGTPVYENQTWGGTTDPPILPGMEPWTILQDNLPNEGRKL